MRYKRIKGEKAVPDSKRLLILPILVVLEAWLMFYPSAHIQAQISSSPEDFCLMCHEETLAHLPRYIHKPFAEKKCPQCHQFQLKEGLHHRFTFPSLTPGNTWYFRLKGYTMDNSSFHISQVYSLIPPSQGGVAITFQDSNGFEQPELVTDRWNASQATLEWKTELPEYCLIEWDLEDSFPKAISAHTKPVPENFDPMAEIGITACYQCHPKSSLGISHPVHVLPSEKIRKKMKEANLPTGKDGLLLCVTCHLPHAGDEKYLGQKAVSEELCVACHSKEIYNPQ
ncbi:MAG: cytochrome c3 family protein [bacterium]